MVAGRATDAISPDAPAAPSSVPSESAERDIDQPYGRAAERPRRSFRERLRERARAERWPVPLSWLDRIEDEPDHSDGGMTL